MLFFSNLLIDHSYLTKSEAFLQKEKEGIGEITNNDLEKSS